MTLQQLKWTAILVIATAVGLLEFVRHNFLHDAMPMVWGNITTTAAAFVGAFIFAQFLFGHISRLQGSVLQRNRELSAVNRLALSVGRSLNPEKESETALKTIIKETGAMDGELFILQNGKLVPTGHEAVDPVKLERANQAAWQESTLLTMTDEGFRAFIPLRGKELLGVVCLQRRQAFLPHHKELFNLMGRYIGSALENAKLATRIEELAVV
jgi:GAF domain-containing protein